MRTQYGYKLVHPWKLLRAILLLLAMVILVIAIWQGIHKEVRVDNDYIGTYIQEPDVCVYKNMDAFYIDTKPEQKNIAKVATITAYCKCEICCGKWSKTDKWKSLKAGRSIAASRSIPFGTRVKIGKKIYVVEDRLAKRYDNRIDIYFNTHQEAKEFGIKQIKVEIIEKEVQ